MLEFPLMSYARRRCKWSRDSAGISLRWLYERFLLEIQGIYIITPVSAGTVFIHQILMSVDVRF